MILKSIFLALLLFILYSIAVISYPLKWWSAAQHLAQLNKIRSEEFVYDEHSYKNVIVGSSLSERLVLDSLPETYSLALGGQSVFEGLNILCHKESVPATVFIEMNEVLRGENKEFTSALFSPVLYYPTKKLKSLRADKQPIALIGAIILEKVVKRFTNDNKNITQKETPTLFSQMLNLQIADYSTIPTEKNIGDNFKSLQAYIKRLEAKNVKMIFFEIPVDPALENLPKARLIRNEFYKYFPPDKFNYLSVPNHSFQTTDGIHLSSGDALEYTLYFKSKLSTYFLKN